MSYLVLISIFLLPVLYESSPAFRYYLKHFLYYFFLSVMALLLIPVFIFRPYDVRNLARGAFFTRWITHLIGLKWQLRDAELITPDSSCIYVSNHQHSLDVLGMFQYWHILDKMTVVAKKELKYAGPFGLATSLAGLMFIDRKQGDRSRQELNDKMTKMVEGQTSLWIFPEGTRRNTNQVHDYKKGAFYLAIQNQIPLQPIVFSSYNHFLDHDKKSFENGEIIVTVLPRISVDGLTEKDIPALIEQTRATMIDVYERSSEEARAKLAKTPIKIADKLVELKAKLEGKGPVDRANGENEEFIKDLKQPAAMEKTIN